VREYVIEDGGVVRRVDHERRADAEGEFATARHELMTSESVTELLRNLAAYLDQKPSKAAIYRCLDHHGLAGYSKGHFTQKWRGGTDWVSRIQYGQLPQVLTLLGRDAQEADARLAKMAELKAAIPVAPILRRLHPDSFGENRL
jgi:hypothetical protein